MYLPISQTQRLRKFDDESLLVNDQAFRIVERGVYSRVVHDKQIGSFPGIEADPEITSNGF